MFSLHTSSSRCMKPRQPESPTPLKFLLHIHSPTPIVRAARFLHSHNQIAKTDDGHPSPHPLLATTLRAPTYRRTKAKKRQATTPHTAHTEDPQMIANPPKPLPRNAATADHPTNQTPAAAPTSPSQHTQTQQEARAILQARQVGADAPDS